MGYTHSWKRSLTLDKDKFKSFVADCQRIMSASGVELIDGKFHQEFHELRYGKTPITSLVMLRFIGKDAQDVFTIPRILVPKDYQGPDAEGLYFNCCKTIRLPYDTPVLACLLALKHWFPETKVRSDGWPEELVLGMELYNKVLGYNDLETYLFEGCGHIKNK